MKCSFQERFTERVSHTIRCASWCLGSWQAEEVKYWGWKRGAKHRRWLLKPRFDMSCICLYVFLAAELLSYDYFPVIHLEKYFSFWEHYLVAKMLIFSSEMLLRGGCRSSVRGAGFFILLPHKKQPRENSRRSWVVESYDPCFCSLSCGWVMKGARMASRKERRCWWIKKSGERC